MMMIYHWLFKIIFSVFFTHAVSLFPSASIVDLKKLIGLKPLADGNMSFAFLSGIEARKKQRVELEKELTFIKQDAERAHQVLTKTVAEIDKNIEAARTALQLLSDSRDKGAKGYHTKKIMLLNDRRSILHVIHELREEKVLIIKQHLDLVTNIIDLLGKDYEVYRSEERQRRLYFTWKDYREIQREIGELSKKIDAETIKKEALRKEKAVETEKIAFLKKQFDSKAKEKESVKDSSRHLELLQLEYDLLLDKNECALHKGSIFECRLHYKEDEIRSYQYQLDELHKKLPIVEKKLVLHAADVEQSKDFKEKEIQRALLVKQKLHDQREKLKQDRQRLQFELAQPSVELERLKKKGEETTIAYYTLLARFKKLSHKATFVDEEIDLIDTKIELENVKVRCAEQQVVIINVRYKFPKKDRDIIERLSFFTNERDLSSSAIKVLKDKRNEAITFSIERTRMVDDLRSMKKLMAEKRGEFKNDRSLFEQVIADFDEALTFVYQQQECAQQYLIVNSDLIHVYQELISQGNFIISELESRRISYSVWRRSPKAISFAGLKQSLLDVEQFITRFFWETPERLSIFVIAKAYKALSWYDYAMILVFIFLCIFLLLLGRWGLDWLRNYLATLPSLQNRDVPGALYKNFLFELLTVVCDKYAILYTLFFIFIVLKVNIRYLPVFLRYFSVPYFVTFFYLSSIPVWVYLAHHVLVCIKTLNQKLSFLFFTEKFQDKFIFLITVFLYASAILLPLRQSFLSYSDLQSDFPAVILAAYSLMLVIVLLFFFDKEDVLKLIPSQTPFSVWLKRKIENYYYPVFFFFMGLLILSNPYVGYSNFAWYLAFAIPSSLVILYGVFQIHNYVRKYAAFFFIKEEEDRVLDKFEHAKTYYGFFIIFLFFFLMLTAFILIARIWGYQYTFASVWVSLSQDLVIHDVFVTGSKLGLVELIILVVFIAAGFVFSSLANRFILNKLFDILRIEPGTQNTVTRIFHYVAIFLATILGFTAIRLGPLVAAISGVLILGIGFGLKDLVADFFAGFWVLIERPIEIGHFIQTGDLMGTVQKIAVRATTIRTAQNYSVVVPNRELVAKPIINWGGGRYAVGFEINLLVNYGADTKVVQQLIYDVVTKHPMVLRVPNIVVRLEEFAENGMRFFIRAFISARKVREQWEVASEIRLELIRLCSQHNISIPYPHRIIHYAGKEGSVTGAHSYFKKPMGTPSPKPEKEQEQDR